MPSNDAQSPSFALLAAIVIGAAIPLLPLGIAVMQGLLGLGLIILIAASWFTPLARTAFGGIRFKPLTIVLAAMLLVWLVTVPWSSDPGDSFSIVLRTGLYMLGCALFWAFWTSDERLLSTTLRVFIVLSAASLTWSALALAFEPVLWPLFQDILHTTNTAPRFFKSFASALVCTIPAMLWAGRRLGAAWKTLSFALILAAGFVMVETHSRSAIAGVLVMVLAVTLILAWAGNRLAKWASVVALLTVPAGLYWVWQLRRNISDVEGTFAPTWLIDPHRQVIWRFTFEKFLEQPWTGHGINRINFVPGADVIREDVGGAFISSHPHNWLLEILSETGVFGFAAALSVLTLLAWRLLARYKADHDPATLALIALCAAFFGSSLFNFSIWSSWWLLTFFTLFALVAAGRTRPRAAQRTALFVVTEDWAFCSHRIPSAQAVHDAGFDVVVTAREGSHRQAIEDLGFAFMPWSIKRKSLNPVHELAALINLVCIFDRVRPDLAYNVTLKPVLYGSIAARFAETPMTINLFAGLGTWFVSPRPVLRAVRLAIMPLLRHLHAEPGTWLMVQNSDDRAAMGRLHVAPTGRTVLVPGSGIDTQAFPVLPEPDGPLTAVLLSRMLWDKGVGEAVEAARRLKREGRDIRVVLVGDPDTENPNHVPEAQLKAWHNEGVVEWWGRREDVLKVWAQAHVALLPSYYREGIPRSLLEGAASARPMIGADSPGCRDLVRDGENGFLAPPCDASAIARALAQLDDEPDLRRRLGQQARTDIEQIYSANAISETIQALIKNVELSAKSSQGDRP